MSHRLEARKSDRHLQPKSDSSSDRQPHGLQFLYIFERKRCSHEVRGYALVRITDSLRYRSQCPRRGRSLFRERKTRNSASAMLTSPGAMLSWPRKRLKDTPYTFPSARSNKPRDAWLCTRSAPMQLAAQHTFHRIRPTKEFLNRLDRGFIEVHIGRPFVVRQEAPVGQCRVFHRSEYPWHRTARDHALASIASRNSQIAFERVQRKTVIADSLAADVAS